MIWVDWLFIGIVGFCTLHGIASGFVQQIFILLRIVLALIVATAVHVVWLPPSLIEQGENLFGLTTLYAISLVVLYVISWLALYFVFLFIKMIFPATGELDAGQRIGGAVLGAFRGAALMFLVVLLVDYSPFAGNDSWQSSVLRQKTSPIAQKLRRGIMQADQVTREHIEKLMREKLLFQKEQDNTEEGFETEPNSGSSTFLRRHEHHFLVMSHGKSQYKIFINLV